MDHRRRTIRRVGHAFDIDRGTHGYAPGPAELDCTFVAYGPGIPARSLARADLTDVARTAAALLGISLPSAGGHDLLAAQPAGSSRRVHSLMNRRTFIASSASAALSYAQTSTPKKLQRSSRSTVLVPMPT